MDVVSPQVCLFQVAATNYKSKCVLEIGMSVHCSGDEDRGDSNKRGVFIGMSLLY